MNINPEPNPNLNPDPNTTLFHKTENVPSHLFSNMFAMVKWFLNLRWYVILLIVVLVVYLFFQIESAFKNRRNSRKNKSHQSDLKQSEIEEFYVLTSDSDKPKKHVSFSDAIAEEIPLTQKKSEGSINQLLLRIYDLWILPNIYLLFRGIGIW